MSENAFIKSGLGSREYLDAAVVALVDVRFAGQPGDVSENSPTALSATIDRVGEILLAAQLVNPARDWHRLVDILLAEVSMLAVRRLIQHDFSPAACADKTETMAVNIVNAGLETAALPIRVELDANYGFITVDIAV
jgi:hypothetical protein